MASQIAEFYSGKSVFITGGTGFLGLALIEKLLRSTEVKTIYLLVRSKKGKTPQDRLNDLTKNLIFEKLLETNSNDIFDKLVAVTGDVGEDNLGLSPEDRELLIKNVNIVLHSAATLDFQQPLKPTVDINILGTRRIVQLCSEITNIKALVHVSSAYVNAYLKEVEEKLYPVPGDVENVIKLTQSLSEAALDEITPTILKDHPNTYTFTKHLAEYEVNKAASKFPCAIVRPSMIVGSWKEPVPGWTISKNGPQGFLMGAAKGVVRRLPVAVKLVTDYIPIDIVANQVIATAYQARTGDLSIFHATSSTHNPFKWEMLQDKVNPYLHQYPLKSAVWYPHLKFLSSLWLFKLSAIFVHFIPAYILDFVTRIAGGRPILVRLHTNVWNSLKLLEPFIFTEWFFDNSHTKKYIATLSKADNDRFNFDIGELVWVDYFVYLTKGVRLYLNNEKDKGLPAARKKDSVLFYLHLALQGAIHVFIWWLSATLLGMPMSKCPIIVPISYLLCNFL